MMELVCFGHPPVSDCDDTLSAKLQQSIDTFRSGQSVTYYGCALKSRKPRLYGILRVTKEKGMPSSQEWTEETFKTWDAVTKRMDELNAPIFASYVPGVEA